MSNLEKLLQQLQERQAEAKFWKKISKLSSIFSTKAKPSKELLPKITKFMHELALKKVKQLEDISGEATEGTPEVEEEAETIEGDKPRQSKDKKPARTVNDPDFDEQIINKKYRNEHIRAYKVAQIKAAKQNRVKLTRGSKKRIESLEGAVFPRLEHEDNLDEGDVVKVLNVFTNKNKVNVAEVIKSSDAGDFRTILPINNLGKA